MDEETRENEKPEGCDFCGWETDDLKFYTVPNGVGVVPEAWLCKVCRNTLAGNARHYPRQYENKDIMRNISYTTNMILDAMKK